MNPYFQTLPIETFDSSEYFAMPQTLQIRAKLRTDSNSRVKKSIESNERFKGITKAMTPQIGSRDVGITRQGARTRKFDQSPQIGSDEKQRSKA